ncbi:hypothetical protein B9G55_11845 [Saccharibacillus sp. O16]|nr:hypothetical protein B9G55_11845 [Saccharibacillus sp. O16]
MFWIKRSLYLMIFYIAVALFTCLAFSAFLESYTNTAVLQDGLTKDAMRVEILPGHSGADSDLKNEEFIRQLEQKANSFVLYKDEDNPYGETLYLHHRKLPMLADQADSPERLPKDHAILDENLLSSTTIRGDKRFFLYQSHSYEVLDTFVRQDKSIHWDHNVFVSLDPARPAYGFYSIDGIPKSDLESLLGSWQAQRPEAFTYSVKPVISGIKDRLQIALQDQALVAMGFGVCMLLMMLSTLGTTLSWVQAKKDEIQARHLVGAYAAQIRFWLLRQYWMVLLLSFVIGSLLAWLIAKWGIFDTLIREVTLFGSFVSLLFCFVIGTLTALIATVRYDRKSRGRKKVAIS